MKDEALKQIAKGRKEAQIRSEAQLGGAETGFDVDGSITYYAVGWEDRIPFPEVSPVQVASIAAMLMPPYDKNSACKTAVELIRLAAFEIDNERNRDERNAGLLGHNEGNKRMWRNLGKRIEALNPEAGTIRKKLSPWEPDLNAPFPISQLQLIQLAGLEKNAGYRRIERTLRKWYEKSDQTPEEGIEKAVKAHKESLKKRGIYKPQFQQFARAWEELRQVLRECHEQSEDD